MNTKSRIGRMALAIGLLAGPWFHAGHAADEPAALKPGDRIVFLGDSITAQGTKGEFGYLNLIKTELTKARPDLNLEIIGAGVSGNKVPDAQKRLEKDVLEKKPAVVVIYLGINDVWHQTGKFKGLTGTPKEAYVAGLKDLVLRCRAAGARVILCTPTVIGEKTDGSNATRTAVNTLVPVDALLDAYADLSRQVATETRAQLLDLHKAFRDHLKANNPENLIQGILTFDGVHLNADGNQFVAKLMLEALQVPPAPAAP
jgi:lysophospholipase L1-like esterase